MDFVQEIEQTKIRFAELRKTDSFINETACIAEAMVAEAAVEHRQTLEEIKILEQICEMCDDVAYETVSLNEFEEISGIHVRMADVDCEFEDRCSINVAA